MEGNAIMNRPMGWFIMQADVPEGLKAPWDIIGGVEKASRDSTQRGFYTMKEHPILFSGPMVRAILEGRKTVTRRVIKPQPGEGVYTQRLTTGDQITWEAEATDQSWKCPYGAIGDRLWVRETHQILHLDTTICAYRASCPDDSFNYVSPSDSSVQQINIGIWRPSIFMSRYASRITLEITDIKVERLQDITSSEVRKEGLPDLDAGAVGAFARMWSEINPKYPWQSNPWLWVIEFKKL
jgi:hypothetical protein